MTFTKEAVLWTLGILGVPALGALIFLPIIFDEDGRDTASVVRVIDGDTVDVRLEGEETRVRLLNVDAPETKHPEEAVQCLGPEASQFLSDLLPVGTEVELSYDVEKEDRYGRILAGMFYDDILVNAQVAAEGLGVAVVYEPNRKFYNEVKEAENIARDEQSGLFDPGQECALPQQIAVVQDRVDQLGQTLPDDVEGVEQELEELGVVQTQVADFTDLVSDLRHETVTDGDERAVLSVLYKEQLKGFEEQLEENQGVLEQHETSLKTHKDELEAEAERLAAEEQRKAEEEERQKAEEEQQRQQQEAAEQQRQLEADERRQSQPPEPVEEHRPHVEQPSIPSAPSDGSGSSRTTPSEPTPSRSSGNGAPPGYGTDSDYPGYTGPRCYAPGGQYWKPC